MSRTHGGRDAAPLGGRVLLTGPAAERPLYAVAIERLERAGITVVDTGDAPAEPAELAELIVDADAVLSTLRPLPAAALERARRLKVIAKVGAGVDNIDVDAAGRRGIPVCNTPGTNAESVADHTLALLLALTRRLVELDAAVRAGDGWRPWPPLLGEELHGKRLGLVGLGHIGLAVARRARAFGMECVAHDPYADRLPLAQRDGIALTSLDALLADSDVVSLHVPLSDATRGMIGAEQLRRMKPSAYLLNTARGPVVDEPALAHALRERWIRGAGIDVFPSEPATRSPLFALPQVVVTPHVAGMTVEATERARAQAAESIIAALRGETPPRTVNAAALAAAGVAR